MWHKLKSYGFTASDASKIWGEEQDAKSVLSDLRCLEMCLGHFVRSVFFMKPLHTAQQRKPQNCSVPSQLTQVNFHVSLCIQTMHRQSDKTPRIWCRNLSTFFQGNTQRCFPMKGNQPFTTLDFAGPRDPFLCKTGTLTDSVTEHCTLLLKDENEAQNFGSLLGLFSCDVGPPERGWLGFSLH